MVIRGARELANCAKITGLGPNRIIPTMMEWEVYPRVAAAIGDQAQKEGLARKKVSTEDLFEEAKAIIMRSRNISQTLLDKGLILQPPA